MPDDIKTTTHPADTALAGFESINSAEFSRLEKTRVLGSGSNGVATLYRQDKNNPLEASSLLRQYTDPKGYIVVKTLKSNAADKQNGQGAIDDEDLNEAQISRHLAKYADENSRFVVQDAVEFNNELIFISRPVFNDSFTKTSSSLLAHMQSLSAYNDDIDLASTAINMTAAQHQLHALGIIHGDTAMRNFLVDEDGNIIICDYGLSHSTDEPDIPTRSDGKIKVPAMIYDVESLRKRQVSLTTDCYSSKATMIAMLRVSVGGVTEDINFDLEKMNVNDYHRHRARDTLVNDEGKRVSDLEFNLENATKQICKLEPTPENIAKIENALDFIITFENTLTSAPDVTNQENMDTNFMRALGEGKVEYDYLRQKPLEKKLEEDYTLSGSDNVKKILNHFQGQLTLTQQQAASDSPNKTTQSHVTVDMSMYDVVSIVPAKETEAVDDYATEIINAADDSGYLADSVDESEDAKDLEEINDYDAFEEAIGDPNDVIEAVEDSGYLAESVDEFEAANDLEEINDYDAFEEAIEDPNDVIEAVEDSGYLAESVDEFEDAKDLEAINDYDVFEMPENEQVVEQTEATGYLVSDEIDDLDGLEFPGTNDHEVEDSYKQMRDLMQEKMREISARKDLDKEADNVNSAGTTMKR